MKYNIQLILALFIFLISSINLAAQDCDVPQRVSNVATVDLIFDKTTISADTPVTIVGYFKMPSNSSHVKAESDWVKCRGFMPGGIGMIGTEILSFTGLPEGLEYSFNNTDMNYRPGESGCVFITGQTNIKGVFPLVIKLKGTGSLLGIKKSYECVVDKFSIVVE